MWKYSSLVADALRAKISLHFINILHGNLKGLKKRKTKTTSKPRAPRPVPTPVQATHKNMTSHDTISSCDYEFNGLLTAVKPLSCFLFHINFIRMGSHTRTHSLTNTTQNLTRFHKQELKTMAFYKALYKASAPPLLNSFI